MNTIIPTGHIPHATDGAPSVVERLIAIFKLEQIIYTSATTLALLILLVCMLILIIRQTSGVAAVLIAAPEALIAYTSRRLFVMFSQALRLAFQLHNDRKTKARLYYIQRIINCFKIERSIHIIVTTASLIMLFTCGVILIVKRQADTAILSMLFGSSGVITFSTNRLLWMWDEVVSALLTSPSPAGTQMSSSPPAGSQ